MELAVTHRGADFDALSSIVAATLVYPGMMALCPNSLQPNVQRFISLHKTAFKLARDFPAEPAALRRQAVPNCWQGRSVERGARLERCVRGAMDL